MDPIHVFGCSFSAFPAFCLFLSLDPLFAFTCHFKFMDHGLKALRSRPYTAKQKWSLAENELSVTAAGYYSGFLGGPFSEERWSVWSGGVFRTWRSVVCC